MVTSVYPHAWKYSHRIARVCGLSETTTIATGSNGSVATPPSESVRAWEGGGTKEKVGGGERRLGEVGTVGEERSRKDAPDAARG